MTTQIAPQPALLHGSAEQSATVPLIHTTMGNVPVSSLSHSVEWTVADEVIRLTEIYRTPDGKIVRQDQHIYARGTESTVDASI